MAAVAGADLGLIRLPGRATERARSAGAARLGFAAGAGATGLLPDGPLGRLESAAEFTVDLTKPTGAIVQIGDNDSGRFLKLLPALIDERPQPAEDHLDHRHLIAAVSGLPHSPQNLLSGAFGEEQKPQITTSAVPHSLQNLRPASLSAPHAEQTISTPAARQAEGYPAGPTRVGRTKSHTCRVRGASIRPPSIGRL